MCQSDKNFAAKTRAAPRLHLQSRGILTEAAHIFSICATTIARQQCFKKNRAFLRHFEDFFNKKMLFLLRRDNVRI